MPLQTPYGVLTGSRGAFPYGKVSPGLSEPHPVSLLQQKIWNNRGVKALTVSCLFLLNLLVAEETPRVAP